MEMWETNKEGWNSGINSNNVNIEILDYDSPCKNVMFCDGNMMLEKVYEN